MSSVIKEKIKQLTKDMSKKEKVNELKKKCDYESLISRFTTIVNIIHKLVRAQWYIYYNNDKDFLSKDDRSNTSIDLYDTKVKVSFTYFIPDLNLSLDDLEKVFEKEHKLVIQIKNCINALQEHYSESFIINTTYSSFDNNYEINIDLEKFSE
jgi:DNA-directed RNA polymerase beta subunit